MRNLFIHLVKFVCYLSYWLNAYFENETNL